MKNVALLMAVAALSGCIQAPSDASRSPAGGPDRSGVLGMAAPGASFQGNRLSGATATPPGSRAAGNLPPVAATTFADLPDRGDLVEYLRPAVRQRGAYTWHAVELSEAHAVNAIVAGEMTVSAPDRTPIRLRYDRHVEHADGNWTWVGHTRSGEQALITFGSSAAFGSIPQGRGRAPLRLTVSDGQSWLVSVDRDLLEAVDNEVTDPTAPDYLVPPRASASYVPHSVGPATAIGPARATAIASSGTVLDLLVGYTPGLATSVGGQSAARTRIQNLVDLANQAYINSRVDLQVRLVHAMQVSYPDATDNGEALQALTGFIAPSTRTEPAAEFAALRAAREQYGADLVTLVRDFRTPENAGCGIAWLIGGGGAEIGPGHEYFGYSVIGDGQDDGTNGSYYCSDNTLAHEIGHNLGSQHDSASAGDRPGRYPYSYGYKATPSTGDFHTIMAYGDSGQTDYRVFSNPRIDFCGGRACGTSQADVARSLGDTSPIIALFRASIGTDPGTARARLDFDGDGHADLLWRNRLSGGNTMWPGANSAANERLATVANLSWFVAGTGDFNGDSRSDVLWRELDGGRNVIWPSGRIPSVSISRVYSSDWRIAGVGDFDGDGRDDILWRNLRTGANTIWKAGSSASQLGATRVNNFDWSVAGLADFNGDGRSDILWRNSAHGANTIWLSGSSATGRQVTRVNNFDWTVAGLGDFDGDGRDDILWRNRGTGANTIWRSGYSALPLPVSSLPPRAWRVAAVDDFDGDGRFDILWRNVEDGVNTIWRSGNSADVFAVTDVPNLWWTIEGSPTG